MRAPIGIRYEKASRSQEEPSMLFVLWLKYGQKDGAFHEDSLLAPPNLLDDC